MLYLPSLISTLSFYDIEHCLFKYILTFFCFEGVRKRFEKCPNATPAEDFEKQGKVARSHKRSAVGERFKTRGLRRNKREPFLLLYVNIKVPGVVVKTVVDQGFVPGFRISFFGVEFK